MSGIFAILTANIIWGAAPAIFKLSLQTIPPFTLAFIRFFVAGLIFLPFAAVKQKSLTRYEVRHIILGGLWGISINVAFFFLGLKLAPSINVHIIGSLGPILLYILSLIVLKEKAHPQILKGMLISLIGTIAIILTPLRQNMQTTASMPFTKSLLGNVFFIFSAIGGVMIVVHNKKVSAEVHPYVITCIQFFVGAITFAPMMMAELETWSFSSLTSASWIGILYGVFFSSALAYFAHNYALTKMPAQEMGLYSYIMPIISVIVAVPLLGEYPDIYFLLGAVLIFIGIIISERHPHLKEIHKKFHSKFHSK